MVPASPSGSRSRSLTSSPSSTPTRGSSPAHPGIPTKRKLSHASLEGTIPNHSHLAHDHASSSSLQKAYISKAVPHLRQSSPPASASTPTRSATPASHSPSARNSPFSDAQEIENLTRSVKARATPSLPPSSNHATPPTTSAGQSRHVLPKGFRGPLPRLGDAEIIVPPPTLLPTPGSTEMFQTTNFPVNRNGWRYTPAGPSSEALPQSVFKTLELEPRGVHWSWSDRSIFTKVSADASVVGSDRGFRSARANVPVREGAWFVEVHVLPPERLVPGVGAQGTLPAPMSDGPHVRLGWGRREAGLNAPAGADGFSYGIRDATGEKVFMARPASYGKPFGPGDVVGMYIRLPAVSKPSERDPWDPAKVRRKRIPIRYRGQLYFETLEYAPTKEMEAMMERCRKGIKMNAAGVPLSELQSGAGPSGPLSQAGEAGETQGVNGSTATKETTKKRRGLKSEQEAEKAAPLTNLRPLVTLGAARSRIGFFINGEPQGTAFTDLLDFRPLRRASDALDGAGSKGKTSKAAAAATSIGLANGDIDDVGAAAITSNSSLASIMKSRENPFDDGTLGYFPFVSCFGGARARIVARREEWMFPPPQDIEAALEEIDSARRGAGGASAVEPSEKPAPTWRALSERFDEFLDEMWTLDLLDEERAQARAALRRPEEDGAEDEGEDSTPGATTGVPSHKKVGASSSSKVSNSKNKSKKATSLTNAAVQGSGAGRGRTSHLSSVSPRDTASPVPSSYYQRLPTPTSSGALQPPPPTASTIRFDDSTPASPTMATKMEWDAPGMMEQGSADSIPLRSDETTKKEEEEEEEEDDDERMDLG